MSEEFRKHPRNPSDGNLRIRTSISCIAYTVSLRDVSQSGAFVQTTHFPNENEKISFEVLDQYGLRLANGHGRVVRLVTVAQELGLGFGVQFDEELDRSMLDFLTASQEEVFA